MTYPCKSPLTCTHPNSPMRGDVAHLAERMRAATLDREGRTAIEIAAIERARVEYPGRGRDLLVRERLSRLSPDVRARAMRHAVRAADAAVALLRDSWQVAH